MHARCNKSIAKAKPTGSTLWNKPSEEWTQHNRTTVSKGTLAQIQKAILEADANCRKRVVVFETPISEETLRSRVL